MANAACQIQMQEGSGKQCELDYTHWGETVLHDLDLPKQKSS